MNDESTEIGHIRAIFAIFLLRGGEIEVNKLDIMEYAINNAHSISLASGSRAPIKQMQFNSERNSVHYPMILFQ